MSSKPYKAARAYDHTEQPAVLRPDIGLQAQFKKKKEPATYHRYDRSLDPQLSWDINADREHAEALIAEIQKRATALEAAQPLTRPADTLPKNWSASVPAGFRRAASPSRRRRRRSFRCPVRGFKARTGVGRILSPSGGERRAEGTTAQHLAALTAAAEELKRMSGPFLNWAGKAKRHTFTVPTLPLFVLERLTTPAIRKSVQTHKQQLDLFADARLDLAERVLRAYEHQTGWVNRLILNDSLVVMNSLLKYEGLGGQVQCIYVDPPYGGKYVRSVRRKRANLN